MGPTHLSPLDELSAQRLADAVAPRLKLGNGRNEWLRWLAGLVMAAVVAYFTTIGTLREQVTTIKTTEDAHFNELLRRMEALQQDVRELRSLHQRGQ